MRGEPDLIDLGNEPPLSVDGGSVLVRSKRGIDEPRNGTPAIVAVA